MIFIKKVFVLTAIIFLVFSMSAMAQNIENTMSLDQTGPAAVVNGEEISRQELEGFAALNEILMDILQSNQEFGTVLLQTESGQELIEEFMRYKLDQLISTKLMVQEAKNRGLEVSDQEINQIIDQQIAGIKQQNNLNDQQLEMALQQEGFASLDEYKSLLIESNMDRFFIEKLRTDITEEITISDAEVEEFYNENQAQFAIPAEYRISHILFNEADKAEEVLTQIESGADFAEMAKEHSIGPTAENGGDLGFIAADDRGIDAVFLNAAKELEVGQVSESPVETQFGFHIIKITDYRDGSSREFAEIKDELKEEMLSQRANQLWNEFIIGLREDAEITINL
ncbi:peptidyl-prolyl cis-trans isomerase [Halanaerobium hydrogeniformans]|uniref:peptidylprolyl isomerase n=1 Tax=Halanaerobium hydrogeniformans TaxID=656519 RepID=E4RNI6_HALHG|nr:peptidyl-prolyl cis-trans isomerase [Halanaerobium hydrogeniformans]ADQ13521.1 PpiC-type peptidyl-prolyl cis-trans isomerase [Halanaerobium hydrogeniformans]